MSSYAAPACMIGSQCIHVILMWLDELGFQNKRKCELDYLLIIKLKNK